MTRNSVLVRSVGADEVAVTTELWDDLLAEGEAGHRRLAADQLVERVAARLAASEREVAAGRPPMAQLSVAYRDDGVAVGMIVARVLDSGPFDSETSVLVDVVHVPRVHRGRGVGQALLREAVCFATKVGADDIAVNVPSRVREANRFFANWGFGPRTLRRVSPVAALRRRLGVDSTQDTPSHLQRLLRRRAVIGARTARLAR